MGGRGEDRREIQLAYGMIVYLVHIQALGSIPSIKNKKEIMMIN